MGDDGVGGPCYLLAPFKQEVDFGAVSQNDMEFIGRIEVPEKQIDAMPAVFCRARSDPDAEGKRLVDWVLGISFRKDWAFGKANAEDHPNILPGPVIQIHTVWKDYTQGHGVPVGFKTAFRHRERGHPPREVARNAGITRDWHRRRRWDEGTTWGTWNKERELVVFARGFPNLERQMLKIVGAMDQMVDAQQPRP